MDFALYQSLPQIDMASLKKRSDCYLESLAQEGRKNDMVFSVDFCLSRIENLALTSERRQIYWERRSISSCASMSMYKCCYICVQDSIFGALSISRQILIIGRSWVRLLASIRYIGKIWDARQKVESLLVWDFPDMKNRLHPIYRQNLEWPAKSKIADRLGFFWHMKTGFTSVSSLHSWRNNRPFLRINIYIFFLTYGMDKLGKIPQLRWE